MSSLKIGLAGCAGSVDEEADEQGIAHLVEHVTFLGSRQREGLLGTGARSNAYTDFHHTVFHVHSPLTNTGAADPTPMLPQVWRENLHSMLLANTTVHHYVFQDYKGILPLEGLRPSLLGRSASFGMSAHATGA